MRTVFVIFLLLVSLIQLAKSQWDNGGYGGGPYGGNYGGGYGGGFAAEQAYNVQNAARIGTEVAEEVLVAEEVSESYNGGFGAQQANNVQNAARIGSQVAEGVLIAEEISDALGK